MLLSPSWLLLLFFFNDTATTEIYTLSLHDALPISGGRRHSRRLRRRHGAGEGEAIGRRSEEHTSELQSQSNLVCRLLLEKKKSVSAVHSGRDGKLDIVKTILAVYTHPLYRATVTVT